MRLYRVRKLTYVLIAWTGLCAAGFVVQVTHSRSAGFQVCVDSGFTRESCQDTFGIGPGATVVVVVWLSLFACVAAIWVLTRPRRRQCSSCGSEIAAGKVVCPACGLDAQLADRVLTIALLAVSLLALVLVYSGTYVVDAGGCGYDRALTQLATQALIVGCVATALLAYVLFVVTSGPALQRALWRYAIGLPVGVVAGVAFLFDAIAIPSYGLLPGLQCS